MPHARHVAKRRFTVDAVVALATVLFALVSVLTALWRFIPGLDIAMMSVILVVLAAVTLTKLTALAPGHRGRR